MFKPISFLVTMLLSSSPVLAAPPRMETLTLGCTPDKLCVEIAPSQTGCADKACDATVADDRDLSLKLSGGPRRLAGALFRLTELSSADEEEPSLQLWPQLIRFEGGILAGVETEARAMYSGGGGNATTLHLIAFLPGQPPFEVLSVPQSANVMIRACFGERDMKKRAGACHDEYNFDANLALTGKSAAGMPVLRYRSTATSFPGPVSRSRDSLAGRPLRKRDLVTFTDPQCSYQRLYRFAPEARSYVPDTPPPDCSNYTEP
ncbi:MAG TPA: hypothetical protein VLC92_02680 [Rhodocyclaceae bacterium]|nr:hypothetical protein [Rhodocyclaceae bacterium]